MSDTLKPCPFCGGKAMIFRSDRYVCCADDECAGWQLQSVTLDAWNRRDTPPGWKWAMVPDYPEGQVVGPCICGSWPGGECLKCPPVSHPFELVNGRRA